MTAYPLEQLQQRIEQTIEKGFDTLSPPERIELAQTVDQVLAMLNEGTLRIAAATISPPQPHPWIKQAVLLAFRLRNNQVFDAGFTRYYDKIGSRFGQYDETDFAERGVRVVPPAMARYGSYVAPDVVLMPSYINIGAFVDSGTMVDTWATVGSCAQIGRHVHLSGGVGIGGVLEPLQAQPTIIEDDCFIGARSEIVEGVVVEKGSVISMGVFIGQSTRIYDRSNGTISYGRIPAGSVVVPGSLPAADGTHSLACAVIVKRVDEKTRKSTSLNELLRDQRENP